MKQIRTIFLTLLIGFSVSFAFPAKGEQVAAMVIASCYSFEATKELIDADKISQDTANDIFFQFVADKKCVQYKPPLLVPLEEKILTYIDFANRETQVWKIKGMNQWALLRDVNIRKLMRGQSI